MNKVHKKLVDTLDKQEVVEFKGVEEAKQLLLTAGESDVRILQQVGLDQEIALAEELKGQYLEKKQHQTQYERQVVKRNDILDFCLKYRLVMRKTVDFNGKVPGELASKLKAFVENAEIQLSVDRKGAQYSKFYIIAPPNMFKGYKNPGEVFKEGMKIASEEQQASFDKLKAVFKDPILVFKIDHDNYALVESWGDDSTTLRRFYGRLTSKKNLSKIVNIMSMIVAFVVSCIGYKLIAYIDGIHSAHITHKVNEACIWEVGEVVIGMATVIGVAMWFFSAYFKALRKHIKDQCTETVLKEQKEFER